MQRSDIRLLQTRLKDAGLYTGAIDGRRSEHTDKAVHAALLKRAATLPEDWRAWQGARKMVALIQLVCHEHGLDAGDVDGFYGPTTEPAADRLRVLVTTGSLPRAFVDITPLSANPHGFPKQSTSNLNTFYGKVCKIPTVTVVCPWTLRLDWKLEVTTRKITIHKKLAGSLTGILEGAWAHYGLAGIKENGLDRYGGSYNCRLMRGSTSTHSTHAWAIAIDWYPSRNKLSWRSDRASLAHPDLDFRWRLWEKQGWLSLGRTEDRDWMHVQAARR